mgnify:CR=1 FL=1
MDQPTAFAAARDSSASINSPSAAPPRRWICSSGPEPAYPKIARKTPAATAGSVAVHSRATAGEVPAEPDAADGTRERITPPPDAHETRIEPGDGIVWIEGRVEISAGTPPAGMPQPVRLRIVSRI